MYPRPIDTRGEERERRNDLDYSHRKSRDYDREGRDHDKTREGTTGAT